MKALSIKQPWAWAICNLPDPFKKGFENRTWNTKYRGEFLVHTSKRFDVNGYIRMCKYLKELGYSGTIPTKEEFVYGSFIGKTELIDVVEQSSDIWFEGTYGFKLENTVAFKEHIPHKGQLNFFNVESEIFKQDAAVLHQTLNGHKFIKMNQAQIMGKIFGLCICDSCYGAMFDGFLIPVLNSVYCERCFTAWSDRAIYYEEDREYEKMKSKYYLEKLNS